jgi:hypothetical protein
LLAGWIAGFSLWLSGFLTLLALLTSWLTRLAWFEGWSVGWMGLLACLLASLMVSFGRLSWLSELAVWLGLIAV